MSGDVLINDLRDRRTATLGVGAALAALAFFAISVAAGMGDALDEMAASFPEAMNTFIGADAPGGYVVNEVFELIAPLTLVAFAVSAGASVIAGEEARGTMSMLSAQPVTRSSILTAKMLSVLATLVFVVLVFWAAIALAGTVTDIGLDLAGTTAASVHLLLLAVFFGAVSLAVGAATGRPDLAVGVGGGLAVLSYLASSMLPLADLDSWVRLSPWHYYSGGDPLTEGIVPAHLVVLGGLTLLAVAVAYRTFRTRDLQG